MAGKGREVADAYIDIHGDLSRFRGDLQDAAAIGREAGQEAADEFGEAWGKRAEKEVGSRWNGIIDAMYSGKKIDWERALGKFDGDNLDEASEHIAEFMQDMEDSGNLVGDQMSFVNNTVQRSVEEIKRLNKVTEERNELLNDHGDALKENKARQEQFNNSLRGMIESARFREIRADYAKLAEAMATTNWSKMAQGHKSMDTLRRRTREVAAEMQELGHISNEEMGQIEQAIADVTSNQKKFGVELDKTSRKFRPLRFAINKMQKSWSRMDSTVRLVLGLIAAAAGPMATLASGVAGSITAVVSSLGMAVLGAIPLATAFSGIGIAIALMVSGMATARDMFPEINIAAEKLGNTWQAIADAFATEMGPALAGFLDQLNTELASVSFGDEMGRAMAQVIAAFEGVLVSSGFRAFIDALSNRIPNAVQGFGEGFAGVMNAVMNVLAAAAPAAETLGRAFSNWGGALGVAAEKARESGVMTQIFDFAAHSLMVVLDLLGSLGKMFGTIFLLGAESGNRMLNVLTGLVDEFTAWMQTSAGQEAMLTWFRRAEEIMYALKPVVVGLAEALAELVTERSIAMFKDLMNSVGDILPLLGELLETVSALGILNTLADLFKMIGEAIQPILPPLTELFTALGPTLRGIIAALTPIFSGLMSVLAPLVDYFAQIAAEVGPPLVKMFQTLAEALGPVFDVLSKVVEFIVGVLAPILGPFIAGIINNVTGLIEGIVEVVSGIVKTVTGIFTGDWKMAWEGVKETVGGAVKAVWNFVQLWIVGKVLGLLKGFVRKPKELFMRAFNAIKGVVAAPLTYVVTLIGAVLANMVAAVGFWLGKIGAFFSDAWNGVSTTTSSIWSGIVTAVTGFVMGIWNAIVTFMTPIVQTVTTVFQTIFAVVGTILNALWQVIVVIVQGIASIFGTIWGGLVAVVTTIFNAIVDIIVAILQGLWAAIQPVLQPVINFLKTAWNGIVTVVTNVFNLIRDIITNVLNAVWGFIQPIITTVVNFFVSNFNRIKLEVTAAFNIIKSVIQVALTVIKAVWTRIWTNIKNFFTPILNNIKAVASAAWNWISNKTSEIFTGIKVYLISVWNGIKSNVGNAVSSIRKNISNVFNNIKNFISNAVSAWQKIISDTWNAIKRNVTNAINAVKAVINNIMNGIKNIIQVANAFMERRFGDTWVRIRTTVSNAINRVRSIVSNVINSVRNTISNILSSIRGIFQNAWNTVNQQTGGALNRLAGAVRRGIDNVVSFVRSLPGKARSALSNIGGALVSAGRNMIQGFINGVKNMAGNIISAARGVVDGAISAAKNLLNLGSPSKLFMQFGEWTGEGLAIGMERMGRTVQSAAAKMAEATTGEFSHSRMFLAGKDAASGLADGMTANKARITGALSGANSAMRINADRFGTIPARHKAVQETAAGKGKSFVLNEGAIQVNSNAKNPETVAAMTVDDLASYSKMG